MNFEVSMLCNKCIRNIHIDRMADSVFAKSLEVCREQMVWKNNLQASVSKQIVFRTNGFREKSFREN